MNNGPISNSAEQSNATIEAIMRDELAHGDAMLGTVGPIIGHLVANRTAALFSEETVARIRGMIDDLARQLLIAQAGAAGSAQADAFVAEETAMLARQLANDEPLLMHCHALALEWEITRHLERSSTVDPILSPMLQRLIASEDDAIASLAMGAMAAQARFTQQMRRMELPYTELPGDLLHTGLLKWKSFAEGVDAPVIDRAESKLRAGFDERKGRAALLARLIEIIGDDAREALSIGDAGAALFVSALSRITGLHRDMAVQCCNERQFARLALVLRSSGLSPEQVTQQFVHLHPDIILPDGFAQLQVEQASQLLNSTGGLEGA